MIDPVNYQDMKTRAPVYPSNRGSCQCAARGSMAPTASGEIPQCIGHLFPPVTNERSSSSSINNTTFFQVFFGHLPLLLDINSQDNSPTSKPNIYNVSLPIPFLETEDPRMDTDYTQEIRTFWANSLSDPQKL